MASSILHSFCNLSLEYRLLHWYRITCCVTEANWCKRLLRSRHGLLLGLSSTSRPTLHTVAYRREIAWELLHYPITLLLHFLHNENKHLHRYVLAMSPVARISTKQQQLVISTSPGCSVSVVVGRRTSDREIASSVPGRCIAGSLGQLSLPSLRGR